MATADTSMRREDAEILAFPARTAQWRVDPLTRPADPDLVARFGAATCLRLGLLPWRRLGGSAVILAPDPSRIAAHEQLLRNSFGEFRYAHCDSATIRAGILLVAEDDLLRRAEHGPAPAESCRNLAPPGGALMVLAALATVCALLLPGLILGGALFLASIALLSTSTLKLLALVVGRPKALRGMGGAGPAPDRLPAITLLVPLLEEENVAPLLVNRLGRLNYPADRLEICLIAEAGDRKTRAALADLDLPDHAQVVIVPPGAIRTKPRALNYALNFTTGSIVGVYDAEDRPHPDQLLQVASHFARARPDVACLQGVLDYHNPRANWIARCFTMEYAAWFRVVLPGLAALGLVVPLGGTTLFLRRNVIEELGGWDAHNVTEDAELGVRLARRGYRTELIDTVTTEEANARAWPWVKQRTRWLKGYAITWLVHSRRPLRLLADLGPRRFLALQVLFYGTLCQFLLAPALWTFWLMAFALPHPLVGVLPAAAIWGLVALFFLAEAINLAACWLGLSAAGKQRLIWWFPAMTLYFPMATVAAWRGLFQILGSPFRWEKTEHGVSHDVEPSAADLPAAHPP